MVNKQVMVKLDILQTKIDSLLREVETQDFFKFADHEDLDNIVDTLQECSGRVFELRQAVQTL